MLKNVTDKDGNVLCDHIWINLSKSFKSKEIKKMKKLYKPNMKLELLCDIGFYIKRNHQPPKITKYGIKITTDIGVNNIKKINIIDNEIHSFWHF